MANESLSSRRMRWRALFGGKVAELREAKGLSQAQLAQKVGLLKGAETVRRWERGLVLPGRERCNQIAMALDCPEGRVWGMVMEASVPEPAHQYFQAKWSGGVDLTADELDVLLRLQSMATVRPKIAQDLLNLLTLLETLPEEATNCLATSVPILFEHVPEQALRLFQRFERACRDLPECEPSE